MSSSHTGDHSEKQDFLISALEQELDARNAKGKTVRVVEDGRTIERLSARQENALYARALVLREQIRHALLTKTEMWKPTDANIEKHIKTEGNPEFTKMIQEFKNLMSAIGADPKDKSTEILRKGRR